MASSPTNPRKRRSLTGAAQRRSDAGPQVVSQSAQPTTPTQRPRYVRPMTTGMTPQQRAQDVAATRKPPPRPLGTGAALKGQDMMTGQSGRNPTRPMTAFGRNMHPATRAGKRFKIGFTSDGRIVHMYGNDVAAGDRRVVLPKRSTNLRAARRKRASG